MENRKGSGIFLGVIGVATLIVAIIGATFAFFGANAYGGEQAVAAGSAVLALGFHEEVGGLKFNLIPADDDIAHFAATNETHISSKGRCIDDKNNEVCGVYEFAVGNPSLTTAQDLYGSIKIASTDFANLYFEILDETNTPVVGPISFTDEIRNKENIITLSELNQTLQPTPTGQGEFDAEDPTKYPKLCTYGEEYTPAGKDEPEMCTATNVRNYKLVMWIKELHTDQTEADSGKTFAAGITFSSASDTSGVTGVIAAAREDQTDED